MGSEASLSYEESKSKTKTDIKTGQTKDTVYDGTTTSETADSVNTILNSGSTNTTANSGSINTTNTAGSQNLTTNSGSVNTSSTAGSRNTTVVGPSNSSTSNTTRTSDQINTSQLLLTKEATDYMVQGILEGTNGLAAVSSGQRASGAYNSTANTLLVNDLLARTAGEVAARSAVTKTVIGGVTTTSNGLTENSGSTTTQDIGPTSATQVIGGSSSLQDIGGTSSTQVIGGSTSIQDIGGSTSTTNIGGTNTKQTAAGTSAEDILTTTDSTVKSDSSTTKAAVKVGWILCTELLQQGRMPLKHYLHGSRVFASYSPAAKRGYYIWAVPALAHLRAHPISRRSKLMCTLLNARAEYLAAEAGLRTARKTILGWAAKHLYWGCLILGYTVARKSPAIYEEVTSNG